MAHLGQPMLQIPFSAHRIPRTYWVEKACLVGSCLYRGGQDKLRFRLSVKNDTEFYRHCSEPRLENAWLVLAGLPFHQLNKGRILLGAVESQHIQMQALPSAVCTSAKVLSNACKHANCRAVGYEKTEIGYRLNFFLGSLSPPTSGSLPNPWPLQALDLSRF